jgi:hypothetical protein
MNTTFSHPNGTMACVFIALKLHSGGDRAGFAPASLFSRRPLDDRHLKAFEKSVSRREGAPYHASRAQVNAAKK